MPHHKSAAKRVLTNEKARQRNVALRSRMRAAIKAVREAKTRADAQTAYRAGLVHSGSHRRPWRHQEGDCEPAQGTPGQVRRQTHRLDSHALARWPPHSRPCSAPDVAPAARAQAQAAAPFPVVPTEEKSGGHHIWAYLTWPGGASLIGLSFVTRTAPTRPTRIYLESPDPAEIDLLYDQAVRNDHYAQASLLTGEAMLAAGLYLRFIRHPSPKRVSLNLAPTRCALALHF